MLRPAALTLIALCALPLGAASPDPQAVAIANSMLTAMGGQDAWNRAHFVRYDFKVTIGGKLVVNRSHLWDKRTGRYRIEDQTKQGQRRVMLFNSATQQGSTFVDGSKLDGAAAGAAMKTAYEEFINDLYWLSMPWKWLDPGVRLKYQGKKRRNGQEYDVVQLTFDHVGITPGDRYQAWVSPQSHLMEHWEYKLQDGDAGEWDWQYAATAGVTLASNHTDARGDSIDMGKVQILDAVADGYFSDPKQNLSGLK
jgi:hypothetical protein